MCNASVRVRSVQEQICGALLSHSISYPKLVTVCFNVDASTFTLPSSNTFHT